MDDSIILSRESVEILARAVKDIIDNTSSVGPDKLERTEVAVINNQRNKLKEALYQAERAMYEADARALTTVQMSANAEKRRSIEDDYSESKEKWIAR